MKTAIKLCLVLLATAVVSCSAAPEGTQGTSALTLADAMTTCSAANGDTCVESPTCAGNSGVCTFGGNSQTGVPMHTDELDCWFYAGPLAGDTAKAVTANGQLAAYACGGVNGAGYPGAPFVVTGTW